jgi:hypothetical protein
MQISDRGKNICKLVDRMRRIGNIMLNYPSDSLEYECMGLEVRRLNDLVQNMPPDNG